MEAKWEKKGMQEKKKSYNSMKEGTRLKGPGWGGMEKTVAVFISILGFRKFLLHCNIVALYRISGELRDHILYLRKTETKLPRKEFFPFFKIVIEGIYSSILSYTWCSQCGRHCARLGRVVNKADMASVSLSSRTIDTLSVI